MKKQTYNKERILLTILALAGIILLGLAYKEITKDDDKAIQHCMEKGYTYNSCMKGLVG